MYNLFKHLNLSKKLSALVIFSIFLSFIILGINFDSFLKENDFKSTHKRMTHGFDRIATHITEVKSSLSKGVSFTQSDESLLASIDLINNYQNKKNYNSILLDEEKKIIVQKLLNKVKLSLNDNIVLYDKNSELIAYVVKIKQHYQLNFISYENEKKVLFSKYDDEDEYHTLPYKPHKLIEFLHKKYYNMIDATKNILITYHLDRRDILIKSHHNILSQDESSIVAHIEMSHSLNQAYFQHLSDDLNMTISLDLKSDNIDKTQSLLHTEIDKSLIMNQTHDSYRGSMFLDTEDGAINIHITLQKSLLQHNLKENRYQLFLLILAVTVMMLILLRYVFYRSLALPLERLMRQIFQVQQRNYSPMKVLKTGDELEKISQNINHLAYTINSRELELKKSQETLTYLSYHDALTTLPNRRFFEEKLQLALESAEKNKIDFALLFLDLDSFKEVNDTLGHPMGDILLKKVSQALKSTIDVDDTLARFGGDEFMILVNGINKSNKLELIVTKIMKLFQQPFSCQDYELKSSISIGITKYFDDGKDGVSLISNADLALHQAKNNGGDTYCYFTLEMVQKLRSRINMINNMKSAMKDFSQFFLLYQPKVSAITGKIIAIEALIRWNSPDGLVRPDEFISLAEETGMIIPLGEWIFEQACKDFVLLKRENYHLEQISINLSTVQMSQSNMLETVRNVIERTNIEASDIELEITESYLATNDVESLNLLQKFRDMNIDLAIDDFGTGYSSLSYLQKLPVTRLKIDKSFIDDLPHSKESVAIATAIITLGKTFGLSITAEGVETKEQLDFLKKISCDEIQGYYYAKPLTLDELREFCKK